MRVYPHGGFSTAIRTTRSATARGVIGRPRRRRALPSSLPGNQPPVPAENRVRRDDAGALRQNPPAEFLASHRESTALGVGQAKWTWAKLLPEDPILLPEIIDHVFLVAVHPASGREYEDAQSVGHSLRLLGEQPLAPTLFRRFANLGRFVAPYGEKRFLGFVETDTENEQGLTPFLRSLVERGLDVSQGLLVIVEGGKGLRAAVRKAFRHRALVQRCQWHKRENVVSDVAKREQPVWRQRLQRAYTRPEYDEALAARQSRQHELEDRNQSAAGSLAEGLDETLTLHRLGVYGVLGRSLKTTNGLESINALIEERCAKVDHWQNSSQRHRWLATALLDIEPRSASPPTSPRAIRSTIASCNASRAPPWISWWWPRSRPSTWRWDWGSSCGASTDRLETARRRAGRRLAAVGPGNQPATPSVMVARRWVPRYAVDANCSS